MYPKRLWKLFLSCWKNKFGFKSNLSYLYINGTTDNQIQNNTVHKRKKMKATISGEARTVNELFSILSTLVAEGKGEYEIQVDEDGYRYVGIEAIAINDEYKEIFVRCS